MSGMPLWRMILTAVNLVGVRFGGAAIGLVIQVLLARMLAQEDVGVVFMGMSASAIMSLAMTAGYPALTMTVLPRYYALGRKTLVQAFHRAAWRDTFIVTSVLVVIGIVAWLFAPLSPELRAALIFGALTAPGGALIRLTSSVANSQRRFQLSYVPDFIFRPGLLLLFLVAMWVLGLSVDRTGVMAAMIAIITAVAIGQAIILGRDPLPRTLRAGRHDLAPALRGRAASMVLIAAVTMAFADIVTLVGGLFLPAYDVAQLGIAIRLAALAGFVIQVTQNFILPDLSAAVVAGDRRLAQTFILRINLIAFGSIACCVLATVFFGPWILAVFGEEYQGAHWPLVLFMVSQLFRAAGGMNQHLLSLQGYQARSASACAAAVALLFAAASLLTPMLGLMGVAIAVILSEAAWAGILGLQAHRYSGYRGDLLAGVRFHRAPAE